MLSNVFKRRQSCEYCNFFVLLWSCLRSRWLRSQTPDLRAGRLILTRTITLSVGRPPMVIVEPVTPGHQGTYAMKVKTLDLGFLTLPGVAIMQAAYNFAQTPTKFGAWVRSTIMTGDTAFIIVALMKGDTVIAATDSCTFKIDSSYSQYTYLEFPIAVVSGSTPDSLYVMVASGLGTNSQVGTELIVDDIA